MEEPVKPLKFFKLFMFADWLDYILLFLGTLGACVMGALQPFMFFFLGQMFGQMDENSDDDDYYDNTVEMTFLIIYCGLAFVLFGYIAVATFVIIGARQGFRFRQKYFKRILQQDAGWYDSKAVAELPSSLSNDTLKVERAVGDKLIMVIFIFSMIVCGMIMALLLDAKLTLITLFFGPIIVFGLFLTNNALQNGAKAAQLTYKKAGGIAEQALQEIKTVAAFNGQKYQTKKYIDFLKDNRKQMLKNGFKIGLGTGIAIFGFLAQIAVVYIVGAIDIENGQQSWITGDEINVGSVVTVSFVSLIAFNNIATLVPAIRIVNQGRYAAANIMAVLKNKSTITRGKQKPQIRGKIEFREVQFSYPTAPDTIVLQSMTFELNPGKRLGVVGSTGSGKSTIVQLLLRFYEPNIGQIFIDGVKIENISLTYLRDKMGLVSQEPLLFNANIYENIQFGNRKADEPQIHQAARLAGVMEFINKFPDGWKTEVGMKGSQLSGGQKQRIAIARAIIRNPAILLLDEATSALDRTTQQNILQALDRALPNCTRVSIAQNLLTIKDSDHIIMIQKGVVCQQGTHQQLIRKEGKYFHLIKMQEMQERSETQQQELEVTTAKDPSVMPDKSEAVAEQDKKGGEYFKKVMQMNKQDLKWLVFGCIGSVLVAVTYPITGTISALMMNQIAVQQDDMVDQTTQLALFMFLLGFTVLGGMVTQSISYPRMSSNITTRMRELAFQKMLSYDAGFFDLPQNNCSALSARLSMDCELLNSLGGSLFAILLGVFLSLAIAHAVAAVFSWKIALVALSVVPVLLFAYGFNFLAQIQGLVTHSYERCGQISSDSILNYKSAKAFNLVNVLVERYMEPAHQQFKKMTIKAHKSGFTYSLGFGLLFFAYSLIFWYGAYLIKEGEVDFREMIAATFTAIVGSDAFFLAGVYAPDVKNGMDAAKRVFAILAYQPAIDAQDESGQKPDIVGRIQFLNVTFSYPNRNYQALKGVSFEIEPGSKFAIIGRTGSGKSTVVQLLQRLYDPVDGKVMIDKIKVSDYNLKYLRQEIGIVSQEPVLFSGTIAQNISYGFIADQGEIERAAQLAQAIEFIKSNKKGFNREVGLKGGKLSGGQKQRVAIARAIIRKPSILILDQATSALDSNTENIVMENLHREFDNITWVMIAHRLKTIQEADHIMVLESGKILEYGSRKDLYDAGGYFYNMISNL